jgi:hypothetical protein
MSDTMRDTSTPTRGYCPHHRVVIAWLGHPPLRDAVCPLDGCEAKLERCKPRQRGAIVDARPRDGRPVLVVREVAGAGAAKGAVR